VYSDGAITYTEAWQLCNEERILFAKVLKEKSDRRSGKNQQELL